MHVLGVDLAWSDGSSSRLPNETGVVAVDSTCRVLDAGWTVGIADTVAWISRTAEPDTLAMIDAPLIVTNPTGQCACDKQVGQRYARAKISANSINLASRHLGGTILRGQLEVDGWLYDDGFSGPPATGRVVSEAYPYTTLVGAAAFGYDVRPVYKRKPKKMKVAEFRPERAKVCDDLIGRIDSLRDADPPIDIGSHPETARLIREKSPLDDRAYKHREDLIDAILCAWTGLLWLKRGLDACQVLGSDEESLPRATMIAPMRPTGT